MWRSSGLCLMQTRLLVFAYLGMQNYKKKLVKQSEMNDF